MNQACALSREFHLSDPLGMDIDEFQDALEELRKVRERHADS
jgi:hypothetical protein